MKLTEQMYLSPRGVSVIVCSLRNVLLVSVLSHQSLCPCPCWNVGSDDVSALFSCCLHATSEHVYECNSICAPQTASTMSGEEVQKGGQKDYYANERNYIHWVHMSLTLGSVSVLIARLAHGEDISSQHRTITLLVSCILAIIGIAFAIYSVRTFFWRRVSMKDSTIGHHANVDEPWGPLILSVMFGMGLFAILIVGWTGVFQFMFECFCVPRTCCPWVSK